MAIYLDLFSGIGGFARGLELAGFTFDKHYFSEIDKHAIANYTYNFNNSQYAGDIRTISERTIEGRPNIITFGFPCQDLSVAGKGKGLSGERSGLFFEAIRLIEMFRPEVFIFENVKGLLSSNNGKDFELVLRAIADLGIYECEWQLLNTAWVLPQNRERVYFIGHLTGRSKSRVFPFTEANTRNFKGQSETAIVRTITAGGHSGGHHSGMTIISHYGHTNKEARQHEICPTLKAQSHGHEPMITNLQGGDICNTIRSGWRNSLTHKHNWDMIQVKPVLTPDRIEKRQNGRRFKENGEPAFTLNTQDKHGVQIDNKIRRLTEIECERLQGFDDNWTKYGNYNGTVKDISKTQRYKMLGNAVTTRIVEMIGIRLLNGFEKTEVRGENF